MFFALISVLLALLSAMDSVHLGSILACSGSDMVTSASVGTVVVNLPSPTVSSAEMFRTAPLSPRVSPQNLHCTSPPTGFRDSIDTNSRVPGLANSWSSLKGIDLLEQVTTLLVDPSKQCGLANPEPNPTQSWSNVVANGGGSKAGVVPNTPPKRMTLEYIPPVFLNDRVVVSPPEDVELLGHSKWKRCIVGHFLDKKLAYTAVRNIAMKIWARFGIREVHANGKGFFFFLFEGEKYHQLLESGPWHFGDKLLVLKLWHPHLKLEKEQMAVIPLWVHFYNVPLELWMVQGSVMWLVQLEGLCMLIT